MFSRTRRRPLAAVLIMIIAALVGSLSACATSSRRLAAPISPAAAQPSSTPSTGAPSPKPSASPTKPKPAPTVITPIDPAKLPSQTGSGPAGSMSTTGNSTVALTFDDGPDPVNTPRMLDLLKKNRTKATFCLVGKLANAYPALVRRIVAEGHTLCNHSWAHSLTLAKQSNEAILKDLTATNTAIHRAAPNAKIKYFRAPGGYFNTRLVGLAATLGMRSLYWSVDTRDWEFSRYGHGETMVRHIIAVVQTKTRRGSIILAHDYKKPDTVTAFATLLPWLNKHVDLIALPT